MKKLFNKFPISLTILSIGAVISFLIFAASVIFFHFSPQNTEKAGDLWIISGVLLALSLIACALTMARENARIPK